MPSQSLRYLPRNRGLVCFLLLLTSTVLSLRAGAQSANESPYYARANSFGINAAYSPDSSHMILGVAENRKLWSFGVSYGRRLHSSPNVNWFYEAEFSPVTFEGDPRIREVITETAPTPSTTILDGGPPVGCTPYHNAYSYKDQKGVTHTGSVEAFCHGRRWTFAQALSPLGLRWSFLPRRKLQPVFTAHVGYMYSNRPVPVADAGSFNFEFDFGPGIEFYRTQSQSFRLEYRFHHISNHNSAWENPGIDNGLFQLSYLFGR